MALNESHLERTIRWMRTDVAVCINGDANVGAMALMVIYISALGTYLSGREKASPSDIGTSDRQEYLSFIDRYFPNLHEQGIDAGKWEVLYNDYRNGLVHEHLMKKGTAISKGYDKPYVSFTQYGIAINLSYFYDDFVYSILCYADDVRSNTDHLGDNFRKRARFLGAIEPII